MPINFDDRSDSLSQESMITVRLSHIMFWTTSELKMPRITSRINFSLLYLRCIWCKPVICKIYFIMFTMLPSCAFGFCNYFVFYYQFNHVLYYTTSFSHDSSQWTAFCLSLLYDVLLMTDYYSRVNTVVAVHGFSWNLIFLLFILNFSSLNFWLQMVAAAVAVCVSK